MYYVLTSSWHSLGMHWALLMPLPSGSHPNHLLITFSLSQILMKLMEILTEKPLCPLFLFTLPLRQVRKSGWLEDL